VEPVAAVTPLAIKMAKVGAHWSTGRRYTKASRALVRGPSLPAVWYRQALRQGEVADRLSPQNGPILTTFGLAQYRVSQYQDALPGQRPASEPRKPRAVEHGGQAR
jgi:hypothetical protein